MNVGRRTTILVVVVTIVVVAAVVAAILMLGPPGAQRQRRMDDLRVRDLSSIERYVNVYFERKDLLPADLPALAKAPGFRVSQNDPETGVPYGYEIKDAKSYRLCATFATDSGKDDRPDRYGNTVNADWAHATGRQCFERRAKKED